MYLQLIIPAFVLYLIMFAIIFFLFLELRKNPSEPYDEEITNAWQDGFDACKKQMEEADKTDEK